MLTDGARYDEIRGLYVDQLAFAWMEDSTTETTRASVDKKIDSFVEGDLEHATEILSALWEIAYNDRDIKASENTPSAVSPFQFCLLARVTRERSSHIPAPDHADHEPCPLGLREDRAHQVDSQRRLFRQEVLGQKLEGWGCLEAGLLFEHNHGR